MTTLGARIWPWVPAGLLAAMLAGLTSMAVIATRDPGFALERDYYEKAVDYDREIEQRAENARLDWNVEVKVGAAGPRLETPVTVHVHDALGPLRGASVSVEAIRNAHASVVLDARLTEQAPGVFEAKLPLRSGGVWELRLTVQRANDRFTNVVRREVREATP